MTQRNDLVHRTRGEQDWAHKSRRIDHRIRGAQPDGSATDIVLGPDGNLWFTEPAADKIARITPSGEIVEFPRPDEVSSPWGIAAGPDGNIWFTAYGSNRIGRFTPAGLVTTFPVPTSNALPWGITSGPDGNLWFTETHGNKIGRISPAGVFAEFPLPNPGLPNLIVVGSDGNL